MAGSAAGGFVARAFEAMLKECGNKKYSELESSIRTYLEDGKESNRQSNIGETNVPSESDSGAEKVEMGSEEVETSTRTTGEAEAELVLNPLRLAFETKNTKMVELALDCLHKLIEYNLLEGDPGLEDGKNSKILADILKIACSYASNSASDSTTLQVLKVLLSAVASTKIRVHGELLLGIIKACSNIALNSKSAISQATSKAMLIQMLRIIFRKVATDVVSSTSSQPKETHSENDSNSLVKASPGNQDDASKICDNAIFVKQRSKSCLAFFAGAETSVGGADIKGLETLLKKAVECEDDEEISRGIGLEGRSVEQHDASCVFRMLCKMTIAVGNDAVTTKSRILSLELLQGLLEDAGDLFTKNIQFIDSMRGHLSCALLQASVSQSPILFQYASGFFSVILLRFRASFKAEIGVFFPLIVLRSLDGADLNQKLSVLGTLTKVCKDPQMPVDLYINYDCDLEAPNLFDKMVATLSKLAQVTQNVDPKSPTASLIASVKTSCLEVLVNLLKSLGKWEKSIWKSERQSTTGESFDEKFSPREAGESEYQEDLSDLEKLQAHKTTVEAIITVFNRKPRKGIQLLVSSQLVENTPTSVAQFLLSTPNLNKAMIGEYLGQQEEFPTAVMHAYIDSLKISGMRFDIAMREFFNGIQLPTQASKIDRIVEKFTARYCKENPGQFKKAESAYVLAYAIIMLNADAHNPMGQPKMLKSDFLHINSTFNDEEFAPQELLEEIYNSVVKEEMKLKYVPAGILKNRKQKRNVEEASSLINTLNLSLPKRSSSTDTKFESEAIIKQIQALIKDEDGNKGVFHTSHRIELLYPMVEAVAWPLLAMSAVIMSEAENNPNISICMEGFKEVIRISHVLGMDTMRYAFLTSLLRYNSLHAPKDMRGKNVEALRTLLTLCNTDILALQGSWLAVLECISRLEYVVSWPAMTATVMKGSNQVTRDAILQPLRELSEKATNQLFLNSINLPSESVVEFFTALCSVSAEELKQIPGRTFSLLKIVEVSYYNMTRIRLVWSRIWSILAQHLIFAGNHADEKVAIFSIESLHKLGMKYLERDELENFSFQNSILHPYAVLMQDSKSENIQKLLLDSTVQIVNSNAGSMKSGWRSIFRIFTTAAAADLNPIVELAFENAEQVILEHFNRVMGYCFMDCVNCLVRFANNKASLGVSLKAVALLHICADRVAESLVQGGSQKHIDLTADEACDVTEQYWFPMLTGLSTLTSDARFEVRNCAIEVLFDLLSRRGSTFSSSFWEKIFQKILFPIVDHVRHAGKENFVSSGNDWRRESCIHALQLLCKLFGTFYKEVSLMLSPLLSLLLDCARKTDQEVVSISLGALTHLIEVVGHQFNDHDWDTLLRSIRDASYMAQPLELLNNLGFDNTKHHKASRNLEAQDGHQEIVANAKESEGLVSPSGKITRTTDGEGLQHSQALGQTISEDVKEKQFMRSLTSIPETHTCDVKGQSSPLKFPDAVMDPERRDEAESPTLQTVRSKCMAQLLLLGIIDSAQKKYWTKLSTQNKITMMEILFSILEFAASYNSYTNLHLRMHQIPAERPPQNLLRLELFGTCIYLDILQKTTAEENSLKEEAAKGDKIEGLAEQKFISFCEHMLKEACDFQCSVKESSDTSIHQVLELRSPIIAKVLNGMCQMNHGIFKNHLRDFYPLIAELVCCQQMEIRGALADLFSLQLSRLLK